MCDGHLARCPASLIEIRLRLGVCSRQSGEFFAQAPNFESQYHEQEFKDEGVGSDPHFAAVTKKPGT
jgi:hypothetical protein